jgi:hypothetical protein
VDHIVNHPQVAVLRNRTDAGAKFLRKHDDRIGPVEDLDDEAPDKGRSARIKLEKSSAVDMQNGSLAEKFCNEEGDGFPVKARVGGGMDMDQFRLAECARNSQREAAADKGEKFPDRTADRRVSDQDNPVPLSDFGMQVLVDNRIDPGVDDPVGIDPHHDDGFSGDHEPYPPYN